MRSIVLLAVSGLLFLVQTTAAIPTPAEPGIVAAEWAFIRHCERSGIKASFVAAFHPDGLIFRPEPANGRDWYRQRPESKATLSWFPAATFTAASGDLGYNTGPWEWRPGPESPAQAFGWFFSVWKRDPAGPWKLLWDIGHPTEAAAAGCKPLLDSPPARSSLRWATPLTPGQALELDRKFAVKAAMEGQEHAYQTALAPAGWVFRSPAQPAIGWPSAKALLALSAGRRSWEPRSALVAGSGEILFVQGGYTRTREGKATESGTYIRVWRRMGPAWTLELDLESPQPPEAEK